MLKHGTMEERFLAMFALVHCHIRVLVNHMVTQLGVSISDERTARADKFSSFAFGCSTGNTALCLVVLEGFLANKNHQAECTVKADTFPMSL